jgi:RNA polymerase sigma factor (sigma-70 family)
MNHTESLSDSIERMLDDLTSYLSSTLNALGCHRYGIEKDDLLQEIRIRIWQVYKSRHNDIKYFNAYIRKIVYSVLIDEIKKTKKENKVLESAEMCLNQREGTSKENPAIDELLRSTLLSSINSLKESKQLVVKLRLEGFAIGEIARMNNWSYRKTCNMFYRAIKELRHLLSEKGIRYED